MLKKIVLIIAVLMMAMGMPVVGQKSNGDKPKNLLHEQAKKAGGKFVLRYKANRATIYPNIEELAKRSDLIVVGRTLGHRPKLRADGNFITRDFLVKVQEVIKGEVPGNSRSIVVSLPGGSFRFADGSYATVKPQGHKQAEDHGLYVFFLKSKKDSVFKGHLLTSETQGLFALNNAKVEPADLVQDDPIVVKYRDMDAAEFLTQIHKSVPRKKK